MTFWLSVIMNWMFVRMERNISSIWLFLFSCTTIPAVVLALSLATGTSATRGRLVRRPKSSGPSTLYFMNWMRYRMTAGIPIPSSRPMSMIMLELGLTLPPNCGLSISLPLSAVAANEMLFSSRFCSNIRYKPDFTSCWRPISFSTRSRSGELETLLWYMPNWLLRLWRWMSALRRAWVSDVRILRSSSSSVLVSVTT